MITRNRTKTVLTLVAVAMAIVLTTTHQVSAAELTYDSTVEVSDNESVFNVSVFPGKAGLCSTYRFFPVKRDMTTGPFQGFSATAL